LTTPNSRTPPLKAMESVAPRDLVPQSFVLRPQPFDRHRPRLAARSRLTQFRRPPRWTTHTFIDVHGATVLRLPSRVEVTILKAPG
jgi:hypothetical protein